MLHASEIFPVRHSTDDCYDIFTKIEIIYVVLYCIISLFVLGVSGRQTKLSNALIKEEL